MKRRRRRGGALTKETPVAVGGRGLSRGRQRQAWGLGAQVQTRDLGTR